MKKIAKAISVMVLLSLCLFITGCGKEDSLDNTDGVAKDENLYCPLDGAEIETLPDRPFVVAIDNGPKSEPQTNLGKADLLFEVPVEGGINRFLAFYYHNQPDVIGPVRSARHPFIPLVNSYNGIYVHCGGSYIFVERRDTVDEIDEMSSQSYFSRDNSRKAPVNLYTSWDKLTECATEKGFMKPEETTKYSFYSEKEKKALTLGDNTSVAIPYTYKPVSYTWDQENSHYLRFSKENPHMDAADNQQLYADNLVVMYMDTTILPDEVGLVDMTFAGNTGEGYLFQNGKTTQIQWSMENENAPLKFTNSGKEVKFIAGRTIVQVVPSNINVSYDGTVPVTENQ